MSDETDQARNNGFLRWRQKQTEGREKGEALEATPTPIEVLNMIEEDMKDDAREFEGKLFNGQNVSRYLGCLGAAIAALASIIREELIKTGGET